MGRSATPTRRLGGPVGRILVVLLLATIVAVLLFWQVGRADAGRAVRCAGEPIPDPAVLTYGRGLESRVGTEFAEEHDVDSYGSDFWSQSYGDERPVDALASEVSEVLAADCALVVLADDLDVDASEFTEAAARPGGVREYEQLRSQGAELEDELRDALLDAEPPDESRLRAAFEALDDRYKESHLAVTVLRVTGHEGPSPIDQGRDLDPAALRDVLEEAGADVEELEIDSRRISKDDLYSAQLLESFKDAEPVDVLTGADGEHLVLIDKRGGDLLTFEQAPQLARNAYVNQLLEHRLAALAESTSFEPTGDLTDILLDGIDAR